MNKQDQVAEIAVKAGVTMRTARAMLNAMQTMIARELDQNGEFYLNEIGKFRAVNQAERKIHNPQGGEVFTRPACRVVGFRASRKLKESINK